MMQTNTYPTRDEVKQRQANALVAAKQAVIDEQIELDLKLANVLATVKGLRFPSYSQAVRDLLLEQCRVMTRYSGILDQRIALL